MKTQIRRKIENQTARARGRTFKERFISPLFWSACPPIGMGGVVPPGLVYPGAVGVLLALTFFLHQSLFQPL